MQRRYIERLVTDIEKQANSEKDESVLNSLKTCKKSVGLVFELCCIAKAKGGTNTQAFFETYDAQLHYCSMAPAAEVRMPRFLVENRFDFSTQQAVSGNAFWAVLTVEKVSDSYSIMLPLTDDIVKLLSVLRRLISEKMVWILTEKKDEAHKQLTSFSDATSVIDTKMPKEVKTEVLQVHTCCEPTKYEVDPR